MRLSSLMFTILGLIVFIGWVGVIEGEELGDVTVIQLIPIGVGFLVDVIKSSMSSKSDK